ncbi:D-alanyl-D-alanine carboxypeptidase family protein [Alcanivorax sp. 1008]|uniref:D-alanyl-D-alanine carboxypeptidase family protein n=1 Tax=Alcanivorax sp. 1008 TaxID=2816853 RepID=UPI001DD6E568|nr:D-alanyl-D-alanine carboxypeptidase family protein [Alcanivorax sp. 1008]MCC1497481.1 D-alanyl-D-alanine carboxypeptidase [Alcanivorax sp. 1008]
MTRLRLPRLVTLMTALLLPLSASAESLIARAPQIAASGYILMDAASGHVLVAHNADERLPPASLTKMMTSYVADHELERGNISLADEVLVSVKAWRTGGSRMFIREGTRVNLHELLKGIIIVSGNDASVAIAEHVAGSEDAFADLMNRHAERLNMTNSHFRNATGLPADGHYSSARDMALLALAIINDYPEHYPLYAEKSFTYNNITQQNRNLLLWRDDKVDGLKTGHTEEAGYCLVASGKQGDQRLISVVMGTSSEQARAVETQKLLTWGFRFFETYHAYNAGDTLSEVQVWMGKNDKLAIGPINDLVMTIPRNSQQRLKAEMKVNPEIRAPISKGETLGSVVVSLDGEVLLDRPLVALNDVEQAGLFKRLWHRIRLFFAGLF